MADMGLEFNIDKLMPAQGGSKKKSMDKKKKEVVLGTLEGDAKKKAERQKEPPRLTEK